MFCLLEFPLPTGEGAPLEDTKVSSASLVPKNRNREKISFLDSPHLSSGRWGEVGTRGDLPGNNATIKAESSTLCSTFHMCLSPLPIHYPNPFIQVSCEIEGKYFASLNGWWSHGSNSGLSYAAGDILAAGMYQDIHPTATHQGPTMYSLCPLPSI